MVLTCTFNRLFRYIKISAVSLGHSQQRPIQPGNKVGKISLPQSSCSVPVLHETHYGGRMSASKTWGFVRTFHGYKWEPLEPRTAFGYVCLRNICFLWFKIYLIKLTCVGVLWRTKYITVALLMQWDANVWHAVCFNNTSFT